MIAHTIGFFTALIILFVLLEKNEDDELFKKSFIDDQLDIANQQLAKNTDVKITSQIEEVQEQNDNSINKSYIWVFLGVFVFSYIIHTLLNRKTYHVRNLTISLTILIFIEFLFTKFISTNLQMLTSRT